ncbi:MAG TPA: hypothetical protein VKX49_26110 [Bryobacteraceae bacterium]|nr:hypothetical protein [Bryobacteraceae bacterium]
MLRPELRLTSKDERFLEMMKKITPPIRPHGVTDLEKKWLRAMIERDEMSLRFEALLGQFAKLLEERDGLRGDCNYWRRLFWTLASGVGLFAAFAIAKAFITW